MFESLVDRLVERQGQAAVHYVTPIQPSAADGLLAETYDRIDAGFLVGPPFTLHSPVPPILAGAWSVFHESVVVGDVPRPVKEAIATAVSKANECPFCVDAHGLSVEVGAGRDVADAIQRGDWDAITDATIRDAARWAAATRDPTADVVRNPPFTRAQAPEYVGTALTFHYVNRMVNVFCEDSPFPIPDALERFDGLVRRVAGPRMRSAIHRTGEPGGSLDLVPTAEPGAAVEWAESNHPVARAFAGFATTAEERVGERFSSAALDVVRRRIDRWDGDDPDMGGEELSVQGESLSEAEQVTAELALTTALASYRVDDDLVERFQSHYPGDEPLVELTCWASLTSALRIGTWLGVPKE